MKGPAEPSLDEYGRAVGGGSRGNAGAFSTETVPQRGNRVDSGATVLRASDLWQSISGVVDMSGAGAGGVRAFSLGDVTYFECTGPCKGLTEFPLIYLCYVRSGTPHTDVVKLIQDFCESQDSSLIQMLDEEVDEIAAEEKCEHPAECICKGAHKTVTGGAQYLNEADADELALVLGLEGGRGDSRARPLNPNDPNVPEEHRVYLRVECQRQVEGKCVPRE